ncbi:MAG: motility associated factor glycosyltransferase family protein [Clostridiales bacterium]|jgi:hypothetical protein|nr:motility associated factor glycosyltransferase family protein [Clostridiales bacterium]
MTDKIKTIFYNNIDLLGQADKAIYYFREQRHDLALGIIADSMDLIRYSIEAIIDNKEYFNLVSTDSVMEMLSGVLEAYKMGDYILLADLLELQLVSFIIGVQELIISKEEVTFDEKSYNENLKVLKSSSLGLEGLLDQSIDPQTFLMEGYRVEFSSSGLMTLAAKNGKDSFYFHTNGRIPTEAFMLARYWYNKEVKRYIIYGLGFGYHINELLSLSKHSEIIIYEEDLNVIFLASAFTGLKDIFETGRVKLVYDPKLKELMNRIIKLQKDEAIYVHYPSYQNIRNKKGRELLKNHVSWSKSD